MFSVREVNANPSTQVAAAGAVDAPAVMNQAPGEDTITAPRGQGMFSKVATGVKNFCRRHPVVTGLFVAGVAVTAAVFLGPGVVLAPLVKFLALSMPFVGAVTGWGVEKLAIGTYNAGRGVYDWCYGTHHNVQLNADGADLQRAADEGNHPAAAGV